VSEKDNFQLPLSRDEIAELAFFFVLLSRSRLPSPALKQNAIESILFNQSDANYSKITENCNAFVNE
jgi:hypothetical protein